MHEPLFSQAAIPERCSVLRLKLRPYAIGHELFLHRQSNPFLLQWTEFSKLPLNEKISGLITASHVCSQTFRENLNPIRFMRLWQWRNRGTNWEMEIAKFQQYMVQGSVSFKYEPVSQQGGTTRFLGAPECARLYSFICETVPQSEIAIYGKSAWDYPIGLARMLFQVKAEEEGSISIYNLKDQAHDDYVAQEEAKEKAEQEKLKASA